MSQKQLYFQQTCQTLGHPAHPDIMAQLATEEHLHIKSTSLTDRDLVALSLTLRNCPGHSTCVLDFSDSQVSDDGITTLCAILQVRCYVDSVICAHCCLSDDALLAFAAVLSLPHKTLAHLDLVGTKISTDGLSKFKAAAQGKVCALDEFRLTCKDDGVIHIIEMLEENTLSVRRLGINMPKNEEIQAALTAICAVKGITLEEITYAYANAEPPRIEPLESRVPRLEARVKDLEGEVRGLRSLLMNDFEQRIATLENIRRK